MELGKVVVKKHRAALCRKIIEAKLSGNHEIEVWGDGEQTRSFMYIDDCITGMDKMWASDYTKPLNLGSSEMVSINQLIDMIEKIAGIEVERKYDLTKPQGVRGRNSDNTLIKEVTGWELVSDYKKVWKKHMLGFINKSKKENKTQV